MARLLCVLLFAFTTVVLEAQIVSDSWLDQLSYKNGMSVAVSSSKVYCATDCSIFSYDKDDNSIEHLTPINGLSEIGIGNIAYSDKHKTLVIGYTNGNIDLVLDNGKVFNMSGVKDKNITSDKGINHINISGDLAYLSSDFGLTAINLERKEFYDTYILGENGNYTKIYCSAIYGEYLYAFTESGLMKGKTDNPFLTDLKNWEFVDEIGSGLKCNAGCTFNNNLFVNVFQPDNSSCMIYKYDGNKWEPFIDSLNIVNGITSRNGILTICANNGLLIFNQDLTKTDFVNSNDITMCMADDDVVWYTHTTFGLCKYHNNEVKKITPAGPDHNIFYNLCYNSGNLLVAPGGMASTNANLYRRAYIYSYDGTRWTTYDWRTNPELDSCRDVINFAPLGNNNHYIINTWRFGLVEFDNGKCTRIYSENTNGFSSDIVSYCTMDHDGNLWAACSFSEFPIEVRTANGEWHSYAYGNNMVNTYTGKVICTKNNDLWMASNKSEGILIWNANGTPDNKSDDGHKFFKPTDKDGEILNTGIHDFAEDKDGTIWFATDEGVYMYEHPERILQGQAFYGRYPQMVEDGVYQPLLKTEIVNTIAIDDANRKWFGTANGGIFVISPDGTKQYAVYNKTNSPLFSNNVTSLAIDNDNGILYIITDKGLQSVRISSSKPEIDLSEIYAFPNPVEPDYYGDVTIRGLMSETVVKITDLYGNLVFETMSNGGSAVWNVCNMDGKRVETGIYLIQCITSDGQSKGVGKIHVIK